VRSASIKSQPDRVLPQFELAGIWWLARQSRAQCPGQRIRPPGQTAGIIQNNEAKITFADIEDSLILVTNSFPTQTSYENQTKKAINNKYIQEFLTDLLRSRLEIWFIENKAEADRVLEQVLVNKRSRESAEKQRLNIKKS
jgi:DNA gyrase/topoisomerase IV subunit B